MRPATENVVALPNRTPEAAAPKPAEPAAPARALEGRCRSRLARWPPGSTPSSPPTPISIRKHFITGARAAYEMIVNAYAEGDRRTLKNLLSREVYDGFESRHHASARSAARRWRAASCRSTRPRSPPPNCAGAPRRSPCASTPSWSRSTRDKNGNVIDGNAEKVTDVTDVWTFARDVSSRDPNWKLVATEAGQ